MSKYLKNGCNKTFSTEQKGILRKGEKEMNKGRKRKEDTGEGKRDTHKATEGRMWRRKTNRSGDVKSPFSSQEPEEAK